MWDVSALPEAASRDAIGGRYQLPRRPPRNDRTGQPSRPLRGKSSLGRAATYPLRCTPSVEPEPKRDQELAESFGDSLAPLPGASSAGGTKVRFDFGAIADAVPGYESQIAEVVARAATATDLITAPAVASEPKETGVGPRGNEDPVPPAPSARFGAGLWLGLAIGASAAGLIAWWAWPTASPVGADEQFGAGREGQLSEISASAAANVDESASPPTVPGGTSAQEPTETTSERDPSVAEPASPAGPIEDPVEPSQQTSVIRADPQGPTSGDEVRPERSESTRRPRPVARDETSEPPATRSVNALLDEALGGGGPSVRTPAPAPAPASPDLPDAPRRSNVAQTLGRLVGPMRLCAAEKTGVAMATISLVSSGRVESVSVSGAPFGGTREGACMESVIRRARFEPFSRPRFEVRYPFSIRPQL